MRIEDAHRLARINDALDRIFVERSFLTALPPTPARFERIAELCEHEAGCWSALFGLARSRVYWRAALVAEVSARRSARHWRRRALDEARDWPLSVVFGGRTEAERLQVELMDGVA